MQAQSNGGVQASRSQPAVTAAVPALPQQQSEQQQPHLESHHQPQPQAQPQHEHQQPQSSGMEAEDVHMLGTTPPHSQWVRQLTAATAEFASSHQVGNVN